MSQALILSIIFLDTDQLSASYKSVDHIKQLTSLSLILINRSLEDEFDVLLKAPREGIKILIFFGTFLFLKSFFQVDVLHPSLNTHILSISE